MYYKHTLKNGVRVVAEHISHVKSVSLGFWIKSGSIHENDENNGITHFIEHMLFKGTKSRTAKQIAEDMDNIGGQINAFTSKECTCYYSKVLDSHLPIAIDVLSDMLFNSNFNPAEIEKEKSVVLEEINMYEDSPEDMAHDLLSNTVFGNHSLGFPILGNSNTINSFDRKKLVDYIENNYTTDNIVIAVAGNFDFNTLIDLLEERFSRFHNSNGSRISLETPKFISNSAIKFKDIEQLHLCIGLEGVSVASTDLYPLMIMNNNFGGSMSSRLFQNIREDRGLAYSVFSYPSTYRDIGLFTIYAGINPLQLQEVCRIIKEEIVKIKLHGLSNEELLKSKEQLKGNYILGLESTSSRMTAIGKSELLLDKTYSQKEILDKIDSVTMEQVKDVIDKVFDLDRASMVAVGKIEADQDLSRLLKS